MPTERLTTTFCKEDTQFVIAGLALSASRADGLEVLAPLAESPFVGDALVVQHGQHFFPAVPASPVRGKECYAPR